MVDLKNMLNAMEAIAKEAGVFIRREALSFNKSKVEYKGLNDLVSYVDKTAEEYIIGRLSKLLPNAGFITEEEMIPNSSKEYNWIIDPLDGTTNFIHGIPVYAVSIALQHHHKIVAGVVYEINRDECFSAFAEGGATLNGQKIQVTTIDTLNETLVATGFPYTKFEKIDQYLSVLQELMLKTRGVRRLGSAAVDLAYVACGRFDAFFEYNLNAWDVAAGALLVQEAGGMVTDFKKGNNYIFGKEIIATNASIHPSVYQIVGDFFK